MNTASLLQSLLVLHLIGLVVMAGITLADMVAWRYFWKTWATDKRLGAQVTGAMSNFPRLLGIGAALLVITGIGMMAIVHGIYGEQVWMRIKIVIVLMVIINAIVLARPQMVKLQGLLKGNVLDSGVQHQIESLKGRLNLFHISQLLLFATIILLSVFKFN